MKLNRYTFPINNTNHWKVISLGKWGKKFNFLLNIFSVFECFMLLFYNLKKTKMVHMYENVFGNWAVRSFKCVFFANYILLHLLLMDFHPAGSVVTGTRALLRHHILQFHSADAASYPSSRQRYFKMDQAQTCRKKWAYYST